MTNFLSNYGWLLLFSAVSGFLIYWLSHQFRHPFYRWAMGFEAKRANLNEYYIKVDGHQYCYFDNQNTKAKETLVLLHGFAATKENWLRFAGQLKQDFRIIAIDLAGHGKSFKDMSQSYDIDDQAERLNQFTLQLGIKQFHLIGNSMGGAITCMFASLHPDRVLTACLLNPAGGELEESELDQRIAQGKNTLIVENEADFKEVFHFTMSTRPYFPSAVKRATGEVYAANKLINNKIWQEFRTADHHYDYIAQLTKIKCPVLVVWGKNDRVLHPSNIASFIKHINNTQSVEFDRVGHLPMIEIPGKLAKTFLGFIQVNQAKGSY